VLLQILWCCRQNKAGFLASTVVSAVAALLCTVGGIIILVFWKDVYWCDPFLFITDDYVGSTSDYCNEGAWATVAFVCAALWFAVAGCILHFVKSGRHAKWEEQLSKSNNSDDEGVVAIETAAGLEMGTVQQGEHIATSTTPTAEEGVDLSQVAAVTMITTDWISDKVDDV